MKILQHARADFTKMLFVFIFLATVPLWIGRIGLYDYIALEILVWSIYAMGYNLSLGYTGLPSFGHGAFFGMGAYGMAVYQVHLEGNSLWFGLILAVCAGVVAGGFTGALISHRRGIYFALLTIAFGQMFWFLAIKLRDVTHGEDGLLNLQRFPADFGLFSVDLSSTNNMYYFALIILMASVIVLWTLIHSSFGYIIRAVKQNEMRAQYIGYNVRLFKWMSFTFSTGIAGLAGGLFALVQQSAFPDVMSLHNSGIIVMMTIIGGGMVSFWGPIIGVMFYFLARDIIGTITPSWMILFGSVFMLIIVLEPDGIAGIWDKFSRRIFSLRRKQNLVSLTADAGDATQGVSDAVV
jgi:branched-chain amino acid transport system permease protein